MLTRKRKIAITSLGIGAILTAAVCLYQRVNHPTTSQAVQVTNDTLPTDRVGIYEDDAIDTMMVGRWQHLTDTTWFRVYTTEPASDGYCWGHEWNTADDIYEDDLTPYGNGWFKWKKTDKMVLELQMTDIKGAIIPYEYKVLHLDTDRLQFQDNKDEQHHHFRRS